MNLEICTCPIFIVIIKIPKVFQRNLWTTPPPFFFFLPGIRPFCSLILQSGTHVFMLNHVPAYGQSQGSP